MIYEQIRVVKLAVCKHYGITKEEFEGTNRHRLFFHARITFAWIVRNRFNLTLTHLGQIMKRDHSSVAHMIESMNYFIEANDPVAKIAKSIDKSLFESDPGNHPARFQLSV